MECYVCIAVGNSTIPIIALFAFKERLHLLSWCLRKGGRMKYFAADCTPKERSQCSAASLLTKEFP